MQCYKSQDLQGFKNLAGLVVATLFYSTIAGTAAGGVVETAVECTLTGGGCTPADYALGASTAGVASRASSPSRNVRQAAWASGERSGFLIHFTDETGYRGIIKDGFSMNASPTEKTAPSGIYFTEAMPFNDGRRNIGPYDSRLVRANVGIDLVKTQYYIVIDPTLLPNAQWRNRDRKFHRLEHILMTDVPFDISSAVIIHGPTSDLNP